MTIEKSVNVINLKAHGSNVAPENQKKHQVSFRAKRGILAGADISGTLEDFSLVLPRSHAPHGNAV